MIRYLFIFFFFHFSRIESECQYNESKIIIIFIIILFIFMTPNSLLVFLKEFCGILLFYDKFLKINGITSPFFFREKTHIIRIIKKKQYFSNDENKEYIEKHFLWNWFRRINFWFDEWEKKTLWKAIESNKVLRKIVNARSREREAHSYNAINMLNHF